ncbi:MAG: succinate dehydrogenase assembly factor 2 [Parahaliea sp.]
MIQDDEIKRMRWASRRGMLELDLVLEPFVRDCYDQLNDEDRARYRRLMECEDQDLFGWFLRREQPQDVELARIVKQILDHKHRPSTH